MKTITRKLSMHTVKMCQTLTYEVPCLKTETCCVPTSLLKFPPTQLFAKRGKLFISDDQNTFNIFPQNFISIFSIHNL